MSVPPTAKATDNLGRIGTSTVVNFEVNYANTNYFVNNTNCVSSNTTTSFQLNSNLITNATNYSWTFSGSGGTITPLASTKYIANLVTSTVLSGDVCVAVNYSVSPTYKKYCKTVSVCNSGARIDVSNAENTETAFVYYDKTKNVFVLQSTKDVETLHVFTTTGGLVHEKLNISKSTEETFGVNFLNGIYIVLLTNLDGTIQNIKVSK